MSDSQLEKVTQEMEAFQKELDLLTKATPPEEAAKMLIDHMSKSTDPFNMEDNEWKGSNTDKQCCVIS